MSTNQEILDLVDEYLEQAYTRATTSIVPKKSDLTFGNTVKKMDHAIVFYVDMRKSRNILSDATDFWSIKIHKAFLRIVTHCLERRDGHLRSFNGDGILAFFIGDNAASRAVRAAMDTKGFVLELNESLNDKNIKAIDFGIGVAQGKVQVAKSGKAGDDQTKQDLVWIGIPVYVALELSEFGRTNNNIWVSPKVRSAIGKEDYLNVVNSSNGDSMWTMHTKTLKSVGEYKVRSTTYYYSP